MAVNDGEVLSEILSRALFARHAKITELLVGAMGRNVGSGPFVGTILPEIVSWSELDTASKLLGCYEAELHESIEKGIGRSPEVVVNVGCAEGYYATGLARRLPQATVYSFDINPRAQVVCTEAARVNGVGERVVVGGECDAETLVRLVSGRRALIFMDCEGCEINLLTPESIAAMTHADLIVECHDHVNPAITSTLVERFQATHDQELMVEGARNPMLYPVLRGMSAFDRWLSICEFRSEMQNWLALWSRGDNAGGDRVRPARKRKPRGAASEAG